MNLSYTLCLALLCFAVCSANKLTVKNSCGTAYKAIVRSGASATVIYSTTLQPGASVTWDITTSNCQSCNVATNTGQTLLAEFSMQPGNVWWNLSTDAGYQNPGFLFYSSDANSPHYTCSAPGCSAGTPGDSHIVASSAGANLFVTYCG